MAIDPKDQAELEHQQLTTVANSGQAFASSRLQYQLAVSEPYHTSSETLGPRTKTPTNQSTGLYSAAGTPRMPVIEKP